MPKDPFFLCPLSLCIQFNCIAFHFIANFDLTIHFSQLPLHRWFALPIGMLRDSSLAHSCLVCNSIIQITIIIIIIIIITIIIILIMMMIIILSPAPAPHSALCPFKGRMRCPGVVLAPENWQFSTSYW